MFAKKNTQQLQRKDDLPTESSFLEEDSYDFTNVETNAQRHTMTCHFPIQKVEKNSEYYRESLKDVLVSFCES